MMRSSIWIVPLMALALSQIAAITTSVYLHRGLAHRSLRLHPLADAAFRTVLWLTTGQTRREWVAVHRKHHTFTDREGDPHSPRLLGLWRVQVCCTTITTPTRAPRSSAWGGSSSIRRGS
jgi:stearoyl-CoA desaturase (delta-9 desaturase)